MARNFLLARFIDDRGGRGGRGGGGGGGGPAEWRIHRASRQRAILDEEKEHEEGEGGETYTETYLRRGNTILKLVRAEQISGPEISLVTRYMYTQGSERERERKTK